MKWADADMKTKVLQINKFISVAFRELTADANCSVGWYMTSFN